MDFKELLKKLYPGKEEKILNAIIIKSPNKPLCSVSGSWYQNMNLYVTYPDSFTSNGKRNFYSLAEKVSYIKNLGMNTIHVLPFLESPQIDAGFDVSNYLKVRDDLGGNEAFEKFYNECKANKIQVFMDLVLNHISNKHKFFQKAQKGNKKYRDYFIHFQKEPKFIKREKREGGIFAIYEIDGKVLENYVVFPDHAGDNPHFVQGKDGYWYFHTFYPHQLDLNWQNPDVFIEFAKIVYYWASKGLHFRLDAIPFVGQNVKNGIFLDIQRAKDIVSALKYYLLENGLSSVFLVEVSFLYEQMKEYFGNEKNKGSELAYDFILMKFLWNSILKKTPIKLADTIRQAYANIPSYSSWVQFLRNHDELSLERIPDEIRLNLINLLEGKGMKFRQGYGFSGRTFSFLGESPNRQVFAYALLASMPGVCALIYGDEIGKANDIEFMKEVTKKKNIGSSLLIADDTRDINRGYVSDIDIHKVQAKAIYAGLKKVFQAREKYREFFSSKKFSVSEKGSILEITYSYKHQKLVCKIDFAKQNNDEVFKAAAKQDRPGQTEPACLWTIMKKN